MSLWIWTQIQKLVRSVSTSHTSGKTRKTLPQQKHLRYIIYIYIVDSLQGACESTTQTEQEQNLGQAKRNTEKGIMLRNVHLMHEEAVGLWYRSETHQCGRRHPAIPPDSCRFLEPRRSPRSYSLGDRSLPGGQTTEKTFLASQRTNLSFSFYINQMYWRRKHALDAGITLAEWLSAN